MTDLQIYWALVSAFEGGSDYWVDHASHQPYGMKDGELRLPVTIYLQDPIDDSDRVEYLLTRELCDRGAAIMHERYPHQYHDQFDEDSSSGDAGTADTWLQFSLFGELIFG